MHGEWFVYLQPKAEKTYGTKFQEITDQDIKDAVAEVVQPQEEAAQPAVQTNKMPVASKEASNVAIFGVAALSILSGLGLVARRKKA